MKREEGGKGRDEEDGRAREPFRVADLALGMVACSIRRSSGAALLHSALHSSSAALPALSIRSCSCRASQRALSPEARAFSRSLPAASRAACLCAASSRSSASGWHSAKAPASAEAHAVAVVSSSGGTTCSRWMRSCGPVQATEIPDPGLRSTDTSASKRPRGREAPSTTARAS